MGDGNIGDDGGAADGLSEIDRKFAELRERLAALDVNGGDASSGSGEDTSDPASGEAIVADADDDETDDPDSEQPIEAAVETEDAADDHDDSDHAESDDTESDDTESDDDDEDLGVLPALTLSELAGEDIDDDAADEASLETSDEDADEDNEDLGSDDDPETEDDQEPALAGAAVATGVSAAASVAAVRGTTPNARVVASSSGGGTAKKDKRAKWPILLILGLLLLGGGAILGSQLGWFDSGEANTGAAAVTTTTSTAPTSDAAAEPTDAPDETPAPTSEAPTTTPAPPATTTAPEPEGAAAEGMLVIPAGTYVQGGIELDERVVEITEFYMDEFEVTNQDWAAFMGATDAVAPIVWGGNGYPAGTELYPLTGVSHAWAGAYCTSLGKRLPTETEWEAAARGPEGLLWPWGDDPDAVDLSLGTALPVGELAGNVSSAGVADLVGNVWEWVTDPVTDLTDGELVRRGGQNGFVRGSTHRQIVDEANQLVIAETGFRCVADTVADGIDAGAYNVAYDTPPPPPEPDSSEPVRTDFVVDTFETAAGSWPEDEGDTWRIGLHGPTWYHVEAKAPATQVFALNGIDVINYEAEVDVFVEDTLTADDGEFRYGLVVRANGQLEPPDSGTGNLRPTEFYAFAVNPRAGTWELLHDDSLSYRLIASGPLPDSFAGIEGNPDTLSSTGLGDELTFSINGEEVLVWDEGGFHPNGEVGFFLETLDAEQAHIHNDSLAVRILDAG